jgi:sulfofructose kinase
METGRKLRSIAMGNWHILGMGAVAVDDLIYVDHYPEADKKEAVRRRDRIAGGLVGNALAAAARLGAKTAYFGILGNDELSVFTKKEFEDSGVDCSQILFDADARPIYSTIIVENPTGNRTIFFDLSGLKQPTDESIRPELIQSCKVLFVDHTVFQPAILAARIARRSGIPVIADIERGEIEYIQELLQLIDHLVIGRDMGKQLTGEDDPVKMVLQLMKPGYTTVIVTDGANGCYFSNEPMKVFHQPALKVRVVETLGCGDIFHGAYAFCLAQNLSIFQAVRIATITAGVKAGRSGGRSGIPDWVSVEKLENDLPIANLVSES